MNREAQEEFWRLYASQAQPLIERTCRGASRKLTDNGMPAEDMAAWVDDRVWRMLRDAESETSAEIATGQSDGAQDGEDRPLRAGWPIFHDSPAPAEAVQRVIDSANTLVRWAYLALCRKHWRRRASESRHMASLGRSERLAMVSRADETLEQDEKVENDLARIRQAIDEKTRARIAATWPERDEARRIAVALEATDRESDELMERVENGEVRPNTVDQLRSRSRARIRQTLGGAGGLPMLLMAFAAVLLIGAQSAPAGEQTGGGRKGRIVCPTPEVALVCASGGEQSGGRGG